MKHRSCLSDDVFFDHQASHIIGSEEECELTDFLALRDPGRLNVRNVVEIQSGDRLSLQVFERTSRRELGHVDAVLAGTTEPGGFFWWLMRPADERGEAAGFVLQLAQPVEVFDPFLECFNMAEHHRAGALAAEFMPLPVDFEPAIREDFSACDLFTNAVNENFPAPARQTPQTGIHQTLQNGLERQFADLVKVPEFRRAESVDVNGREILLHAPQ